MIKFIKNYPKIHKFKSVILSTKLFSISTLVDVVRIPPTLFGTALKKAAVNILKEKYESMINTDLGYIIMILDAKVEEMGKMIPGNGGTFHKVEFDALTFYPKLQEIIQGEIVDITDFGAFVRIGPTDALLHLSQVMDEYLKSDVKSGMIIANESGKTLRVGSTIRSRITAVSLGKAATMGKIGITCRQPYLGADEWIAEEIKKSEDSEKQPKSDKKTKKQEKVVQVKEK
ncbi:MAG: DNA-directed RNA polymerase subunit E' [Nitrosopumilales archaeon]|nr:MAG: DNA-directed RNA polymerase subunit E' [Nitrosopumilales archaeon]